MGKLEKCPFCAHRLPEHHRQCQRASFKDPIKVKERMDRKKQVDADKRMRISRNTERVSNKKEA